MTLTRRRLLREGMICGAAFAAAPFVFIRRTNAAWARGTAVHPELDHLRVVGITDPQMTRGEEPNAFWGRQEELTDRERIWENIDRLACVLAQTRNTGEAWRSIFVKPPGKTFADAVVAGMLLFAAACIQPAAASAWWGYGPHYRYGHHHHGHTFHFGLSFPLHYYDGYTSRSVRVYREPPASYGGLTLDVRPESAQIFLNGRMLGTAADLRDQRLSVEEGEHQLRLKSGAFSTFYRVEIRSGTTTHFSRTIQY